MKITLTNKEIVELRRLRGCLDLNMVPVIRLGSFLEGLEQKIKNSTAPAQPVKRKSNKIGLKETYRMQIMGGKKQTA